MPKLEVKLTTAMFGKVFSAVIFIMTLLDLNYKSFIRWFVSIF